MDPDDYVAATADAGHRVIDAAREGLDRDIGTCPGWSMAKLVLHLGLVHRGVASLLTSRSTEPWDFSAVPRAPDGDARVGWFAEGLEELLAALDSTPPDAPVWSWAEEHGTAVFWQRRMAHETTIHAWDADAAGGKTEAIPAELAADGIDEMLEVVLTSPRIVGKLPPAGLGGTLHLHCTDVPGEWLVRAGDGEVRIERRHAKGDAALRGRASELDLFVWNRLPAAALEMHGDPAVPDAWSELVRP